MVLTRCRLVHRAPEILALCRFHFWCSHGGTTRTARPNDAQFLLFPFSDFHCVRFSDGGDCGGGLRRLLQRKPVAPGSEEGSGTCFDDHENRREQTHEGKLARRDGISLKCENETRRPPLIGIQKQNLSTRAERNIKNGSCGTKNGF